MSELPPLSTPELGVLASSTSENCGNTCFGQEPEEPGFWERTAMRLFPLQPAEIPEGVVGEDVITNRTWINFSLVDRIRILVSGRVFVETKLVTEKVVGQAVGQSEASVLAPRWMVRLMGGSQTTEGGSQR